KPRDNARPVTTQKRFMCHSMLESQTIPLHKSILTPMGESQDPLPQGGAWRRVYVRYRYRSQPIDLAVDVVDGPLRHQCARMRLSRSHRWEPSVNQIIRIGMDTSKYIFQLHGVDASEQVVLRKRLGRNAMLAFLAKLPPTVIVIEACGAAHYLARELGKLGHTAKLIAPQLVKPYVPRNKNDGRDAEGLCEAASRPRMRYVPVKTAEQQAALMLLGIREQLVGRRTQLSNTIRGHAAEFGLIAAKGLDKLASFLAAIERDERVPAL